MKVILSDRADADLLGAVAFLADRSPAAAISFAMEIDSKIVNLSQFPFIGRERSGLLNGLRSVVVGYHVIFYLVKRDHILIVRVLDGRRDTDAEIQR